MDKKQIPLVVGVIVVLVAVLSWWGLKNFGPEGKIVTEASTKQDNFISEMKKKSGGDFSCENSMVIENTLDVSACCVHT